MGSKAYLSYIPTVVSLYGIPLWINHLISEPSLLLPLALPLQIKDLQAKYGESSPVIAALHLEIMAPARDWDIVPSGND
jgi:hypothetical protein